MLALIDRLIPGNVSANSDEEQRRARLIVYATLFAVVVPVPVSIILTLTGDAQKALIVLLCMVPSAATLGALHATGSTSVAGHYLTAWVFLQTMFQFGPESSFSLLAIFAIPILACAMISERAGVFWTLASIAWVASIGWSIPPTQVQYFGLIWSTAVVVGVIGFAIVVLEATRTQTRLEAEHAMREMLTQRERLRAFAENSFPAIAEVNDGETVYVSDGVLDVLGHHTDEFKQRPLQDYVHPDDLAEIMPKLTHSSVQSLRCEARMRHREGNWVWLEVYAIPHGPGTDRWIFAARDIDAEISRRDTLQQAQRLESVGVLAAGMAHDFNNLLTVSMGFAEMLPVSDERDEIINATNEAATLTRQLLSFARIDGLGPAAVECHQLIDDIQPMLRGVLSPGIALSVSMPDAPLSAAIAAGQLHQILINLCTNANEAMPDGGQLQIAAQRRRTTDGSIAESDDTVTPRWVEITVQDTGVGMSPHVRKHAFDPFFTTKEGARGSGLGLASVYSILNSCGGSVELLSQEGVGTTVVVRIPAATAQVATPKVYLDNDVDVISEGSPTILVVEDEISVRSVLVHTLERAGYIVETASNGYDALSLIKTLEPDLIITDLVMAGLGGADLARRVRKRFPHMCVLFTSGYSHLYEQRWGTEPNTRFLAKPFRGSDLLLATRSLLAGSAKRAGESLAAS